MRRQFLLGSICLLCLVGGAAMALAANTDVALFQEALAPYGEWLQHPRHGLVWRPTQVDRSWRPYTNGRWVLTQDGYVFETDEPWGWATYHYGNWQNSPEYGWIWVPGTTWYPHTVTWRSNDEYVGWAPVPPPDIANNDLTWQDDYSSGGSYSIGNYYANSLPPSYWNFTRAMDFLLGWGEPYAPGYSYARSGFLVVPYMVPVVYERTIYIYNYVTPAYAPRACFNWGPPVTYITKVKRLPYHEVQRFCQRHRLEQLHHVLPPRQVMDRHPAWRQLVPVAQRDQAQPVRWWKPTPARRVALNHPHALDQVPGPGQPRQQARPPETAPTPPPATMGQSDHRRPPQANDQGLTGLHPGRPGERRRLADQKPAAGLPVPSAMTPTPSPAGSTPTADRPGVGQETRRLDRDRGPATPGSPQGQEQGSVSQTIAPDRREQATGAAPINTSLPPTDGERRRGEPPRPQLEQARPSRGLPSTPDLNRQAEPPRGQLDQERLRAAEMAKQQADRQRRAQQEQQWELRRQEQERRQADILRQQQAQQQRHLELVRQQQEQQRQAVLQQQQEQRRQAELMRQQQEQQRRQAELIRQQQEQQRRHAEMARQQHQNQHQSRQQPPHGQKRRPPFEQ